MRPVILFLLCAVILSSQSPLYAGIAPDPTVRVAVIDNAASFKIDVKGRYDISELKSGRILYEGYRLTDVRVSLSGGVIKIEDDVYAGRAIKVRSERSKDLYINGRRFRGEVNIVKNAEGKLTVVNELPIDEYLYGVMHNEVSHWWPLETIKAQAIAARTYAMYQKSISKSKDYDLKSDVSSQVYSGAKRERLKARMAVDRTKGMVLNYRGAIFPTFFHSACGGHTEDANELWNINIAPLKGVLCDFCNDTKHYRWKRGIKVADLSALMVKAGYKAGRIEAITGGERNLSGRLKSVDVITSAATYNIPAKDLRRIAGVDIIRSLNFTAKISGEDIVFEGYGWGHGVGLCQWGAYVMGRYNYTADEILQFYYPGATIVKLQ